MARPITEPCAFRVLGLPVTEDVVLLGRRIGEARRGSGSRGGREERASLRAASELADPVRRAGLVRRHCEAFREMLESFHRALPAGVSVPPESRSVLEDQGVKLYHLAPELAGDVVGMVLRGFGCSDDGVSR